MERLKILSEGFGKKVAPVDTNTSILVIFLLVVAAIIAIAVIYNYLKNKYGLDFFNNLKMKKGGFYSLAKSVGLINEETKELLNIITKYKVKYPLTCFTNSKILDDILRKGLHDIDIDGFLKEEEKNYKDSILINIKLKIESNLKKSIGIKSTHLITENQKMVLFIRGKGYFYASLIKNVKDYLAVMIISELVTKRLFSLGDFLKIYFWRAEDAGYTFETQVLGLGDKIREYHLKHSDELNRSQKRKYRRIPVNIICDIATVFYRIIGEKKTFTIGQKSGQGTIVNLSAGGLKIKSDRISTSEKFINIVFDINKNTINAVGKIIRLYEAQGIKEITMQFVKISNNDINIINRYVYRYFPGL